MKILKFKEFVNESKISKLVNNGIIERADDYIKSVLSKFGLDYKEGVINNDGKPSFYTEFSDDKFGEFYIFATHPNKDDTEYNIEFLVNSQIEALFTTP